MIRHSALILLLLQASCTLARHHVYNAVISRFNAAPDGFVRSIIGVNGQYPAPAIHVNKGDTLDIRVTNLLSDGTSLHAHGLFQRGTPWYDGVSGVTQCPIPPGTSFTYELDTEGQAGTTWYHAHFKTQYVDGFVGPLIIHDPHDPHLCDYDEEFVVMLSDWYHRQTDDLLMNDFLIPESEGEEPVPKSGLINGMGRFDCSLAPAGSTCYPNAERASFRFQPGKRYRLRIINASGFTAFQFSIDGHKMHVISADLTSMEKESVDRLNINVAQRYDVIVEANQAVDNYWMRATMMTSCMPENLDNLDPFVVATVHYSGAPYADPVAPVASVVPTEDEGCIDLDPHKLRPLNKDPVPAATRTINIEVDFQNDANGVNVGIMNGISYKPKWYDPILLHAVYGENSFATEQHVVNIDTSEVIDLVVVNKDDGEHPFHLHGHDFYVLEWAANKEYDPSTAQLNTVNPPLRDTSTIPKSGYTVLRFKADNPGTWAFHCHIDWHNAAGLVMVFNELPQLQKRFHVPNSVTNLCHWTFV